MRWKSIRSVLIVLICWLVASGAGSSSAADMDGAHDHPMIQRYPGQELRWQLVENHIPYLFPAGPVTDYRTIGDALEIAGRVTRTFYAYEGTDRTYNEIWQNCVLALEEAGFGILGRGAPQERAAQGEIGGRKWFGVALGLNPWSSTDPDLGTLTAGTSTQGGSAAVMARKERAAGTAYLAIYIEQHSAEYIGMLVDIIEIEAAETGLVAVDAEAIGKGLVEYGRVVLDGIVFDYDTDTLRSESGPTLEVIATYLLAHPDKRFFVVGHTDSRGTFAYNENLSRQRARTVVEALKKDFGIPGEQIEPHGVGPLAPVFSNDADAGRERNRRVELVER